jgi:hypothetical protein
VQELQQRAGYGRLAFPQFEPTLGLGALGETYRVECLDPLAPAGWNELQERISGARDPRILMSRVPPERLATAYDIAGVRTIATVAGTSTAEAQLHASEGDLAVEAPGPDPALPNWMLRQVDENADALPRAYFVSDWKLLTRSQALARVAAGNFDFHRSVILERAPAGLEPSGARFPVRAAIVAYAPERVEIEVQAGRPGLLVLSDSFFPGWRAWVDDVETEILRANGLFRAVAVSAGSHRVRFEYRPASLRFGATLSAVSLGLLCAVPLAARSRRRRRA